MGNRAVITTQKVTPNSKHIGVYLHWCGSRPEVEAILSYCQLQRFRPPEADCYGWARLCQVAASIFHNGLSVGIDTVDRLDCDNWDNGVYIIQDWEIVDRQFFQGDEDCGEPDTDLIQEINRSVPEHMRLDEGVLTATETPTNRLNIGDVIYVWTTLRNGETGYAPCPILGFGEEGRVLNGTDVSGIPYIRKPDNINNYLFEKTYRKPLDSDIRKCSHCGQPMVQGYCIGYGDEYYCSEECLHKHYTKQEYNALYEKGYGYWTQWETYTLD